MALRPIDLTCNCHFCSYRESHPDAFKEQEKEEIHIVYCPPCGMAIEHPVRTKPTPSPEKCECSPACNHGYSERCNCCGALDKPKDAAV